MSRVLSTEEKALSSDKLEEDLDVLRLCAGELSLEEMYNLEYSNRLWYIRKTMEKRGVKGRSWSVLVNTIDEEIIRVKAAFFNHWEQVDQYQQIKTKYKQMIK